MANSQEPMAKNMKGRTEIAELGEFGLIDHLTAKFQKKNSSTICGVGDDAAAPEMLIGDEPLGKELDIQIDFE